MANFKPLLGTLVFILFIGLVLNVFVAPFVDASDPVSESVLEGFSGFVENGLTINVPVVGELSFNIFGIFGSSAQDYLVEQINIMTYIPDAIALIILILSIAGLVFSVVTIIRGN